MSRIVTSTVAIYTCVACGVTAEFPSGANGAGVKRTVPFKLNGAFRFASDGFDWQGAACTRIEQSGDLCDACVRSLDVWMSERAPKE